MLRVRRPKKSGFTLVEILVVVVILAVLGALIIPRILGRVEKAKEAEAFMNLGAIRSAEILTQNLTGKFVAAEYAAAIKAALGLSIEDLFYSYKIIDVTDENFLAVATPKGLLESWLQDYAMDKDGFVGYNPSSGGGSSSGGSGGGSGGSAGGSLGGGIGGISSGGTMGGTGTSSYGVLSGSGCSGCGCWYMPTPPRDMSLTSNDSWLVFSCMPGAEAYIVERTEKNAGILGGWQTLANSDFMLEDKVNNGQEYCYRATWAASPPGGCPQIKSAASSPICGTAGPNAAYTAAITGGELKLDAALLQDPSDGAPSGAAVVDFLNDPDGDPATNDAVPILFGKIPPEMQALAYFSPITKVLVMDADYANEPAEFIALLLAHEGLHRIWDEDWQKYISGVIPKPLYGNNPDGSIRSEYAYYNEYSAFTTEAMAWESFFPNTGEGYAAKKAFYDTLDSTGKNLFEQQEYASMFFLDSAGNRVSFPAGIPPNVPPGTDYYGKTTLEILTSGYGYDIPNVY